MGDPYPFASPERPPGFRKNPWNRGVLQSLEITLALDRTACMLRGEVPQDKSGALLDTAALTRAAGARFVIVGGLAVQRSLVQPRFTADINVVIEPGDEPKLREALEQPPFAEVFDFVHRKRSWTALVHRPSGTEVDLKLQPPLSSRPGRS